MIGRASGKKKLWRWAFVVVLVAVGLLLSSSAYVEQRYGERLVTIDRAPVMPVALVFGAGLGSRQTPSPVLAERLDTAIALYRRGKARKLLVSGDNGERHHDETHAMRRYAIDHGVPPADVVGDFAGFSTYDSCYRAREVFGVDQALLVSQHFHLPRALFIANSLGIDAYAVAADADHVRQSPYSVRELVSRAWALVMVWLRPEPRLLGPREPIR